MEYGELDTRDFPKIMLCWDDGDDPTATYERLIVAYNNSNDPYPFLAVDDDDTTENFAYARDVAKKGDIVQALDHGQTYSKGDIGVVTRIASSTTIEVNFKSSGPTLTFQSCTEVIKKIEQEFTLDQIAEKLIKIKQ